MGKEDFIGMENCFFCNKPKGIILHKRFGSVPKEGVYDKEPCDECKEYMKQGVIVIGTRDGETGDNPYRSGRWYVVKDSFIENIVDGKLREDILKHRVVFMEDSTLDMLGFDVKDKEAQA